MEMPMYSPNDKGKLYSLFVFQNDNDPETQLSNCVNYHSIKWNLVEQNKYGVYKPTSRLVVSSNDMKIITNTQENIKVGDIIYLPPFALWGNKGKYFTVEHIEIKFINTPKPHKAFQYLTLQLLDYEKLKERANA
jgi:hypothetical protein